MSLEAVIAFEPRAGAASIVSVPPQFQAPADARTIVEDVRSVGGSKLKLGLSVLVVIVAAVVARVGIDRSTDKYSEQQNRKLSMPAPQFDRTRVMTSIGE